MRFSTTYDTQNTKLFQQNFRKNKEKGEKEKPKLRENLSIQN